MEDASINSLPLVVSPPSLSLLLLLLLLLLGNDGVAAEDALPQEL